MHYIGPIVLILGGILAASGFIISKAANAKALIDKLVPFQGFIGVGLLAWGLIELLRRLGDLAAIARLPIHWALGWYGYFASLILLGFLLGMPQIAKWIPGESAAEVRAMETQKKLAGFNTLLGFVGIVCAVLVLVFIVKYR